VQLYVNGAPDGSPSPLLGTLRTTTYSLYVGYYAGSTLYFKGSIDEVHVFDRALTGAEISDLYSGTEKGSYANQYFDSTGRMTRSVQRDLFSTLSTWQTFAYNFRDQIVSSTVPRNASTTYTTTYEYDFLGRPTRATYPGTSNPMTIAYNDVNRIRTVTAENGRKVEYLADLAGRTTTVREYYDATNSYATSYLYDDIGNLVSVTNALGQVTQHAYDTLNRLTRTTYPDPTKAETYTYDANGNLWTKTDRSGQVTSNDYDARGRLWHVDYSTTPANPDLTYSYDADDRMTSITSPFTTVPNAYVSYDALGRPFDESVWFDKNPGTAYRATYTYDAAGRLTYLTYPDNSVVAYGYDALGRTGRVNDTATTFATFSYYADGLTKDVALGNGITESYAYNGRGWPTSIRATAGATTYLDLGYTYDDSGNVLTMGSASSAYDKLDRLKSASGGFGTQDYTYDALGNRLSLSVSVLRPNGAGSSAQWTRVGSCSANWQCVDEPTSDGSASYVATGTNGYQDLYGLQDLSTSGPIESVTVSALASGQDDVPDCEFPPCPIVRAKVQLLLRTGGTVYAGTAKIVGFGATPDSPVLVESTWTTNPRTGQAWTLSDVNALEAGISKYSGISTEATQLYVSVRFQGWATYAVANGPTGMNELTSLTQPGGTTTFAYDANGNLRSRKGTSWSCYAWNPDGLLSSVTSIAMGSTSCDAPTSPQTVQTYRYDGLGRRLKVEGATSSTWTLSIFSGQDVVFEKDDAGSVTKYVIAAGLRIAKITPAGVQYYLGDHLGSTRKILDSARTERYSVDYQPFGKPYSTSGPDPDPYKFTSEKHDDPTGLVYLRARQYDPDLGRFVSADPVLGSLAVPQTLNRYAYVVNNPLKYTDPSGEFINLIAAGIGALAGAIIGGVACAASQGWSWSDQCWIAMGAGAAAGGLAGLTFGASLVLAGAAGLSTSGLAAAVFAGATSGAVFGATNYMATGGLTLASGGSFEFSTRDFANEVGWGIVVGGVTAGAGWGVSRLTPKLRVWWNRNVADLREGSEIRLQNAGRTMENWVGRGYARGEGGQGPRIWRDYGDTRLQARLDWFNDPRGPGLNLEVWTRNPMTGGFVKQVNEHIWFYDTSHSP